MPSSTSRRPGLRSLHLLLLAVLLLSSGTASIAAQSTPAASPVADDGTTLYLSHESRLTARIPATWERDHRQRYE